MIIHSARPRDHRVEHMMIVSSRRSLVATLCGISLLLCAAEASYSPDHATRMRHLQSASRDHHPSAYDSSSRTSSLVSSLELRDYQTRVIIKDEDDQTEIDVTSIPTTRYEWLKSISSILKGEPIEDKDKSRADDKSPYIVVFKNSSSVSQLRDICMQYGIHMKSSDVCNMPEVCRRVYASTFRGVSGYFSKAQLKKLLSCFENTVDFVEKDKIVYKAEAPNDRAKLTTYGFDGSATAHGTEYPVSQEMLEIGTALESKLRGGDRAKSGLPAADPGRVSAFAGAETQDLNVALWNLDRIDQR